MIGPLTAAQAAAIRYRQQWGWPVFASSYEVWLRLPAVMAAVSVIVADAHRARLLPVLRDIAGPVIDYADGRYAILTHCVTLHPDHLRPDRRESPVAHLGVNDSVDLPFSRTDRDDVATWLSAPREGQPLPDCVETFALVRRLLVPE